MRIKFLLSVVCFILLLTENAYVRMRISACPFFRLTKIKYGHGMRVFQTFIKKFFAV